MSYAMYLHRVQNEYHIFCMKIYRVSHNTVPTLFLLFSRVQEHIQRNFLWPSDSPQNFDFKTHLTFHPT